MISRTHTHTHTHTHTRTHARARARARTRTCGQAETNMSPLFQSWGHKKNKKQQELAFQKEAGTARISLSFQKDQYLRFLLFEKVMLADSSF